MRIFVTGGTGFIGRHLIPLLYKAGHNLLLLEHKTKRSAISSSDDIQWLEGNLAELEKYRNELEQFKPQGLIHLAWEGLPDYSFKTSQKNFQYTLHLFNLVAELGCTTILSTGTCWEYRENHGKVDENGLLEANNSFAALKNAIRYYGGALAKDRGLRFYWPRLFYVYGPGQRKESLIPHIIESFMAGSTPDIRTPQNRNDFVYVGDVARALVALIEKKPKHSVYNVGSGQSTSVQDALKMTQSILKVEPSLLSAAYEKDVTGANLYADITRITSFAGWQPLVELVEGITKTIKHYEREG